MVKRRKLKQTNLYETGSKTKLTLSVDKNVVEKAKKIGINISEITESVLRGFSFEPKKTIEAKEVLEKYKELFRVMIPILKKINTSVEVGQLFDLVGYNEDGSFTKKGEKAKHYEPMHIGSVRLGPDGLIWFAEFEEVTIDNLNSEQAEYLSPPKTILSNFIDSIVKGMEKQKETVRELEMAKRIIKAIGEEG